MTESLTLIAGHLQLAALVHLVEAMHAGGGLFGEAADAAEQLGELVVDHRGEVAAVVEDQVERLARREEQRLLDAPVELLVGHALPGVDGNAGLGDGAGGVILRREDVAAAPGDFGAQLGERLDQHGRLDRHVQAAGDAGAGRAAWCLPYFSRRAISPGISFSASSISLRPHSASRLNSAGEQSTTL